MSRLTGWGEKEDAESGFRYRWTLRRERDLPDKRCAVLGQCGCDLKVFREKKQKYSM